MKLCFWVPLLLSSCSSNEVAVAVKTMPLADKIKVFHPPVPWSQPIVRQGPGDRVVLLHGLWQSNHALEGLAVRLNDAGYEVINLPYRSFRDPLEIIVRNAAKEVGPSDKPTHFVSHSMGGIVIRQLADEFPDLVTGRIVMIAPPNQGSEIIDWLSGSPLARWTLGPGGMALSTENVRSHMAGLPPRNEVGVIMGSCKTHPFFQHLLPGENDGTVRVEGGRLPGLSDFTTVNVSHVFMPVQTKVAEFVENFLKSGKFSEEDVQSSK